MSKRAELIEKYRKSDIFNLSSNDMQPVQNTSRMQYLSSTFDNLNFRKDSSKPITNIKKSYRQKKYSSRYHQSDIFNTNNIIQSEKSTKTNKKRNAQNYSTCFDAMKDNVQYANDIKDYTKKKRGKKVAYNPVKYFKIENPQQRLYSQYYDTSRNPITFIGQKKKSMMKSSTDLFSKMNLNSNNIDTNTNTNTNDKNNLPKDVENAFKTHKFYKTKGFTYFDYEGYNNDFKNNSYIFIENNPNDSINNCKIKKQIQLQSNIFNKENLQKNQNDINKIKQRIKLAESTDESKPKKYILTDANINKTPLKKNNDLDDNMGDKNIWGALHNNWEKSNMDWKKDKTELIFNKTNPNMTNNKEKNITAFQRKMNHLADSNYKDTINESIKVNRKNNVPRQRFISNLEQIDEILNDIPDNVLKYDKKKKILDHANTMGLNGESDVDKNILNYKKFHKNNNNKTQKEPTIKIMSKESKKHLENKKLEEKNCSNRKKYEDYNIHDYILSYDGRKGVKSGKNSFDQFSENQVKLLFSKNGVHIYDIKRNMFNKGKTNIIKFKVRENEGEQILNEKMKEIENKFNEKEFKITIKKDEDKNYKKNLRNMLKPPFTKKLIFIDDLDNKSNTIDNDKMKSKTFRKNQEFSKHYVTVNSNYKNHYKEELAKNKVNK